MNINSDRKVAYFSMEIGLEEFLPTYSGGLGVLAGDTVRTAADLRIPFVAVTLLSRHGYFAQQFGPGGQQIEQPEQWDPTEHLTELSARITVHIEGRPVQLRAWQHNVQGVTDFEVPVIFLDSDLPDNEDYDRSLSHHLYSGDLRYRLCQEVLLGIGGVRMLRELGYEKVQRFHMNEGHAALLVLELLKEQMESNAVTDITKEIIQTVKEQSVFTTHTPVPAGHDQFPMELARKVIGDHKAWQIERELCCEGKVLNMTYVALKFSKYINGVSKEHGKVSQEMFNEYMIDSITNGVHMGKWSAKPFAKLFDKYIPAWRNDNFSLRYSLNVPKEEVAEAHRQCKHQLIDYINSTSDVNFSYDVFTIGFARRATAYKRASLILSDPERLRSISRKSGKFQIVFAGKAHPADYAGKDMIKYIFSMKDILKDDVKIVYLPDYGIRLAKLLVPGVDIWLNTPRPPREASGTSGMKAAVNAVPSFSVPDGWWIEGCVEGLTGWAIGTSQPQQGTPREDMADAESLYGKLETIILPKFYNDYDGYLEVMRNSIALNGSFFNTQRMLHEYVYKAYF